MKLSNTKGTKSEAGHLEVFKSKYFVCKGIKQGFIISNILHNRSDINAGYVFFYIYLDMYTPTHIIINIHMNISIHKYIYFLTPASLSIYTQFIHDQGRFKIVYTVCASLRLLKFC